MPSALPASRTSSRWRLRLRGGLVQRGDRRARQLELPARLQRDRLRALPLRPLQRDDIVALDDRLPAEATDHLLHQRADAVRARHRGSARWCRYGTGTSRAPCRSASCALGFSPAAIQATRSARARMVGLGAPSWRVDIRVPFGRRGMAGGDRAHHMAAPRPPTRHQMIASSRRLHGSDRPHGRIFPEVARRERLRGGLGCSHDRRLGMWSKEDDSRSPRGQASRFRGFRRRRDLPFGHIAVTAEAITRYARAFDPQPFHLSEEQARDSNVGRLIASGYHTCCMMMRMARRRPARRPLCDGLAGPRRREAS